MLELERDIIFYDGTCGACQRFIRFIASQMKPSHQFFFASKQGSTFSQFKLQLEQVEQLDTIVIYTQDKKLLLQSDAILYVFNRLGGIWKWMSWIIYWIPTSIRNYIYRIFASKRKFFSRFASKNCPIPSATFKSHFID